MHLPCNKLTQDCSCFLYHNQLHILLTYWSGICHYARMISQIVLLFNLNTLLHALCNKVHVRAVFWRLLVCALLSFAFLLLSSSNTPACMVNCNRGDYGTDLTQRLTQFQVTGHHSPSARTRSSMSFNGVRLKLQRKLWVSS